jgi:hypothetical protein
MEGYRDTTDHSGFVPEKRLNWPQIATKPLRDGQYQVKRLRRSLITSASDLWRSVYPELYGSPHELLLDPARYDELIAIEDTWEEDADSKSYCMPVIEELGAGKIVAASLLTKFDKNLQVELSFVAVHPDYQIKELVDELYWQTHLSAYHSGAEYFTACCDVSDNSSQERFIREGWNIAGIFPGHSIRCSRGVDEYRSSVVHFYKFLGKSGKYASKPEEWHLAPRVKEAWDALEKANQSIQASLKEKMRTVLNEGCRLSP